MRGNKLIGFTAHGSQRIHERGLDIRTATKLIAEGIQLTPRRKDHRGVVRPYENEGWRFIVYESPKSISVITGYHIRFDALTIAQEQKEVSSFQ